MKTYVIHGKFEIRTNMSKEMAEEMAGEIRYFLTDAVEVFEEHKTLIESEVEVGIKL